MNREWLKTLVAQDDDKDHYLWPNTPTGNLQAEIWRRCGASDWNKGHPNSRSGAIIRTMDEMGKNTLLPNRFSVLDLCCGDGVILQLISRTFAWSKCYGIDLIDYPEHDMARRAGVEFFYMPLQRVIRAFPPQSFDIVIMLNTFRGWDRADFDPETESTLPQDTLAWMRNHSRYVFLTVTREQQEWLKREGFWIWDIGKGEDDSRMICGFPAIAPGRKP